MAYTITTTTIRHHRRPMFRRRRITAGRVVLWTAGLVMLVMWLATMPAAYSAERMAASSVSQPLPTPGGLLANEITTIRGATIAR